MLQQMLDQHGSLGSLVYGTKHTWCHVPEVHGCQPAVAVAGQQWQPPDGHMREACNLVVAEVLSEVLSEVHTSVEGRLMMRMMTNMAGNVLTIRLAAANMPKCTFQAAWLLALKLQQHKASVFASALTGLMGSWAALIRARAKSNRPTSCS
jgi:hypothetical protein